MVDENYVVLLGKCSNTKRLYLVKYAKHLANIEGLETLNIKTTDFKLVGAYPIDEENYNDLSDGNRTVISIRCHCGVCRLVPVVEISSE